MHDVKMKCAKLKIGKVRLAILRGKLSVMNGIKIYRKWNEYTIYIEENRVYHLVSVGNIALKTYR